MNLALGLGLGLGVIAIGLYIPIQPTSLIGMKYVDTKSILRATDITHYLKLKKEYQQMIEECNTETCSKRELRKLKLSPFFNQSDLKVELSQSRPS